MPGLKPIFELMSSLLDDAHQDNSPLCASEDLYNEGWLLRLALAMDFAGISCLPVRRDANSRWLSETLMYSPFQAAYRGDTRAERHTHADGILGSVSIESSTKRGLRLSETATQFVVFEAKIGSKLSGGTKNAGNYDQAVRNVACMAEALRRAKRPVKALDSLGFFVISPEKSVSTHALTLTSESMLRKIDERIGQYEPPRRDALQQWKAEWFQPLLERAEITTDSWENVIHRAKSASPNYGEAYDLFYQRCLGFAGVTSKTTKNDTEVLLPSILRGFTRSVALVRVDAEHSFDGVSKVLHVSWKGQRCGLRDYSKAIDKGPKPDYRFSTSSVVNSGDLLKLFRPGEYQNVDSVEWWRKQISQVVTTH
jgi:hypothetical protein